MTVSCQPECFKVQVGETGSFAARAKKGVHHAMQAHTVVAKLACLETPILRLAHSVTHSSPHPAQKHPHTHTHIYTTIPKLMRTTQSPTVSAVLTKKLWRCFA